MHYIDVYENDKLFITPQNYKLIAYIISCAFGFIIVNIILCL
jgi:hypothetical protein